MIVRFPMVGLRLVSLLAVLTLAACSSVSMPSLPFSKDKSKAVDENAYPTDYRNAVLATVRTSQSFDPTNIREASISEPALKPIGTVTRYVVCARFNPRNMSRQYMGLTEYVAYFYAGDINQFVKATGDVCAGVAYQPFPELEKICLAEKCG